MSTRALVYGDIDLNLIDGSAIWLQSVTQALAAAGCEVTLVLKAPVRTSRLIDPLLAQPGVTVRHPFVRLMRISAAPEALPDLRFQSGMLVIQDRLGQRPVSISDAETTPAGLDRRVLLPWRATLRF